MPPSKAFLALSLGFLGGVTLSHFLFAWTILGAAAALGTVLFMFSGNKKSAGTLKISLVLLGFLVGYIRILIPSPPVFETADLFTGAQLFFQERIERTTGGEPQAMFSAMVLGYREDLSQHVKEVLNTTGTRHVVAISGLHMTIVGVIIFKLLIAAGLWRRAAVPLTLFMLALYVLLVGAPPSAIRAGVMAGLYLGAGYTGHLTQTWRLLLIAAIAMVLLQPDLLFDIGFQLSFAAVLGIIFFKPLFDVFLAWVPWEGVRDLASVSMAAQLTTWPLIAYTFESVSLISPLANIAVVPLLPLIMSLGMGFLLTGWLSGGLAQLFVWPAWVILKGVAVFWSQYCIFRTLQGFFLQDE